MLRLTFAAFLLSALLRPLPLFSVESDAIVGTGSAASCTESEFNSGLASVQASSGGTLTFNCGGAATIGFSSAKIITSAVTLQGANQITLDGGNTDRLFIVSSGGSLTLGQITLQKGYSPNGDGGAVYVDSGVR